MQSRYIFWVRLINIWLVYVEKNGVRNEKKNVNCVILEGDYLQRKYL